MNIFWVKMFITFGLIMFLSAWLHECNRPIFGLAPWWMEGLRYTAFSSLLAAVASLVLAMWI